jgi:ferredoxin
MPKLTIDSREVEVPAGSTVLDAARALGLRIPALCLLPGRPANTSCMACVVRVAGRPALVPSCATRAEEGMRVESETDEVLLARRDALELLLSEHAGDCHAPCQRACPAGMDIPLMIRQIGAGRLRDALVTVKARIALPAVLGRICPAPCEGACRRRPIDGAVSVCLLKRHVADEDLASAAPFLPGRKPPSGRRVAIVGAGPAGLAAAWHLLQEGHACTLFDDREKPGGMLRHGTPEADLPRDVLDAEIALIVRLGAELRPGVRIGRDRPLEDLRRDFDAVAIAAGEQKGGNPFGLPQGPAGIQADAATFATPVPGVFAGGNALRSQKIAIRAVAHGLGMAVSIGQLLSGKPVTGEPKPFSSVLSRPTPEEQAQMQVGVAGGARVEPATAAAGFAADAARRETLRCLHCDCRKLEACLLKRWSEETGAKPGRYGGARRPFTRQVQPGGVVYEPGKCISCGICVRIAEEAREPLGLAFVGRGFGVRVGVPFNGTIAEGLTKAAAECVKACPTGALAFLSDDAEGGIKRGAWSV